ncbi:MAG: thioredoxin family protein [Chloroflexaceae bacterium]|nr:thioredoxin family protein [Chloroflexaceae bacterium]
MKTITIYGTGCAKCQQAEQVVRQVVSEFGDGVTIEKVADYQAIAQAGVMSTPAVAMDGVVRVAGRLPKASEVKEWLVE